jgi:hypothetical protein
MKRRKFLVVTGLAGLAAAITSFRFVATSYDEAAVDLIKRELSFLSLDDEGVRKFVAEFTKDKNRSYRMTIRGYSFLHIGSKQSGKVNQLVSAFLLSSDFFSNRMDESRVIKYVGLYDPYVRPCSHPFSAVHYS